MEQFTRTIDGAEFVFHGFLEGENEVCRISVDNQSFRMVVNEHDKWHILQQVPLWIKKLEDQLGSAIEEAYC